MATVHDSSPAAVTEQLLQARVTMLLKQPFWGVMATRLILKDATDDPDQWCPTAATDGRYMYYNRNFISKLDKNELVFLLAHETEHSIYDHMSRRGSRNPKKWNAAADYVVNLELTEHNVGKFPNKETCGVQGCMDEQYRGMFTEEVYELLMKDPNQTFPEFDVHMEPGDGSGEPLSEEERKMLTNEIKSAVMQAAKSCGAGKVPAGVARMIQSLVEPQMDWKELLLTKIKSSIKNDYTWTTPSRKSQSTGIYLPGMLNDNSIDIAIAVDASGSMSDSMLRDLLTEVKGIMQQFTEFSILLWTFDTAVYNFVKITHENIDDIDKYTVKGGGGTEFKCNWKYMKQNDICPDQFVMFTDGYNNSSDWGDPDYCESLFIIHGDTRHSITSPFGTTAYYEKQKT